jgi:hypothetical protein
VYGGLPTTAWKRFESTRSTDPPFSRRKSWSPHAMSSSEICSESRICEFDLAPKRCGKLSATTTFGLMSGARSSRFIPTASSSASTRRNRAIATAYGLMSTP